MSIKHAIPSGGQVNQDDYHAAHILDGTPGMLLDAAGNEVNPLSLSVTATADGLSSLFTTITSVPAPVTAFMTSGYSVAGIGGARYIADASVTTTSLPTQKMIAGRGFKLDPAQHLTIEMFGAVAGGTMAVNGATNLAAITAAINFKPLTDRNLTPTIHWPLGTFYCSATLNVNKVVHWRGSGNGANGTQGTRIATPVNVTTIINHNSNTTEAGAQAPDANSTAYGSIYFGLCFMQESKGTGTAYGFWMRGAAQLIQCSVFNAAKHAIYINCTATTGGLTEGDCNNWVVDNCFVHTCGRDALHIQGNDANAGSSIHFITAGATIGGCGIYDSAGLGNYHENPQISGYGNNGVFHLGRNYQLISADGDGGSVTPGTNRNVWYPLSAAAAELPGTFPQWVSGATYYLQLPLFITAPSTVSGGYQEFGSLKAHCPGATCVGTPFVFTSSSNVLKPWGMGTPLGAQSGIGAYRGSGSDTATPEYPDEGAYSYTVIGGLDPITTDRTKRPAILDHRTEQDGDFSMAWHWSNKDQYLRYLNQKPIWSFGGPGTARTYGRSTAQPYFFTLHDYAIQDATDANNARIHGMRTGAPTTGNHAQGEFVWNVNPAAGGTLGWVCVASGTPGTWKAVGGIAA